MTAYYNEIDPFAAQWLRELIKAGEIAPGDVDERSIEDVTPDDLRSYTQCHFFAGIGVWSRALRTAGWTDDRPVWTGSCPCQPFSAAGKGAGFDDERHLWPAWFWLIEKCRPSVIIGEQVASKDAEPWIDLVQDDLEAVGYGVGAVPFPAASVGAPHIRDRLYWMAHTDRAVPKLVAGAGAGPGQAQGTGARGEPDGRGAVRGLAAVGLAYASIADYRGKKEASDYREPEADRSADRIGGCGGASGGLGDSVSAGLEGHRRDGDGSDEPGRLGADPVGPAATAGDAGGLDDGRRPGPVNGFWGPADWLFCRDGKWRPVEPGTFPLAHGVAARVGRLRGYGNAINAVQAQVFVEEVMHLVGE